MLLTSCLEKFRPQIGVLVLTLTMCTMLCGCSSKAAPSTVTKIEYVYPPDKYMRQTPEPKIENYPRTGAGLATYVTDTAKRLREANDDKAALRLYVDEKRKSSE